MPGFFAAVRQAICAPTLCRNAAGPLEPDPGERTVGDVLDPGVLALARPHLYMLISTDVRPLESAYEVHARRDVDHEGRRPGRRTPQVRSLRIKRHRTLVIRIAAFTGLDLCLHVYFRGLGSMLASLLLICRGPQPYFDIEITMSAKVNCGASASSHGWTATSCRGVDSRLRADHRPSERDKAVWRAVPRLLRKHMAAHSRCAKAHPSMPSLNPLHEALIVGPAHTRLTLRLAPLTLAALPGAWLPVAPGCHPWRHSSPPSPLPLHCPPWELLYQ